MKTFRLDSLLKGTTILMVTGILGEGGRSTSIQFYISLQSLCTSVNVLPQNWDGSKSPGKALVSPNHWHFCQSHGMVVKIPDTTVALCFERNGEWRPSISDVDHFSLMLMVGGAVRMICFLMMFQKITLVPRWSYTPITQKNSCS